VHPVSGGWRGLLVLGVGGGIIPCPSALLLLIAAVQFNKIWWALPLLLAFSAGLASVLVLIGILVVRAKKLAGKRWERSRLGRVLPALSAATLICLGLVLCYKSLQPSPLPTATQTSSDGAGQ
jgi:ABC-type nickel/cobalt efflux system permease component RcnA